jgi:hypothetical protein
MYLVGSSVSVGAASVGGTSGGDSGVAVGESVGGAGVGSRVAGGRLVGCTGDVVGVSTATDALGKLQAALASASNTIQVKSVFLIILKYPFQSPAYGIGTRGFGQGQPCSTMEMKAVVVGEGIIRRLMSVTFLIIPFEYDGEFSPDILSDIKPSDYKIDLDEYKRQLVLRWKDVILDEYPVSWQIINHGLFMLQDNDQTLMMKNSDREFALWHRAFVPAEVRLFITGENLGKAMELKSDTTAEELDQVFS